MLLTNYSDLDYVFSLDPIDFYELVIRMFEAEKEKYKKEVEDKLYFRWVYESPFREETMSFEQYKNQMKKKPRLKNITEEDNVKLIERIERIRKRDQAQHP